MIEHDRDRGYTPKTIERLEDSVTLLRRVAASARRRGAARWHVRTDVEHER